MVIDISLLGPRTILWIAAQLHLFFASFALGAPVFIVLCEYLGLRTKDTRYERLAKEMMKVVVIVYSLTAITGVLFVFVLFGPYQRFTSFLFTRLYPIFAWYFLLIFVETIIMYLYWYSWEPLAKRKSLHIGLGVGLNVIGTAVMFLINAVGALMLTPPKSLETADFWALVNNASWMPLNLHRFIANITLGGFVAALFAAFMFLTSRRDEDRAFYDWMGYIGNLIGVSTLLALPLAGYIYARELFRYDASISTFMMADKLSSFFVLQGLLVALLFLGANLYMWLSMQRIGDGGGGVRFGKHMRGVFVVIFLAAAVWVIPQNFLPDLLSNPPPGIPITEIILPEKVVFLGLMMAKALAVTAIIIMTFVTYLLYRRARVTGKIVWGQINPLSQYVLVFIPVIATFTMGIMGSIRELARQDFHIFGIIRDVTPFWFTPTLAHSSMMVALVTVLFFFFMTFIFWMGFKLRSEELE